MTSLDESKPAGRTRADNLAVALPACICLHPGPLTRVTITATSTTETFRFTCNGCGKARDIEVAHGARLPRFLP
jgi:hypothetical protein